MTTCRTCQANYWSVRRLCNCGDDIRSSPFFGTGYSSGELTVNETTRFVHVLDEYSTGAITHIWTTGIIRYCDPNSSLIAPKGALVDAVFRVYVDDETEASVAFQPSMATGVGFSDPKAPWGTKWF